MRYPTWLLIVEAQLNPIRLKWNSMGVKEFSNGQYFGKTLFIQYNCFGISEGRDNVTLPKGCSWRKG